MGYRVEEIQRAIDARESIQDEDNSIIAPEVRLFLHKNVGASAWGLAIHREARMIAISANTHRITVLAFALASPSNESPESDFSESYSPTNNMLDFPSPREHDHIITLRAGHNVPAVSFNNNAEEPNGRWLFSTCITGEIELWDLHNLSRLPARKFEIGWCADPSDAPRSRLGRCGCLNADSHPHGAWGAMFLDPRSAHEMPAPLEVDEDEEEDSGPPYLQQVGGQKERFAPRVVDTWVARVTSHNDPVSSASSEMMVLESESESGSEEEQDSEGNGMGDEMMSIDEAEEGEEEETHTADSPTVPDSTVEQGLYHDHNMDDFTVNLNTLTGGPSPPLVSPELNFESPIYPSDESEADNDTHPINLFPPNLLVQQIPPTAQQIFQYALPSWTVYEYPPGHRHRIRPANPYCQIEANHAVPNPLVTPFPASPSITS